MIKKIIIISILSLPFTANAADVSVKSTIVNLRNLEGHSGPIITLSNMDPTAGSCTRNDYYILPLNHIYFAQNYSLLLTAKMAEKKVHLTVEFGDCVENFPRVKNLSFLG